MSGRDVLTVQVAAAGPGPSARTCEVGATTPHIERLGSLPHVLECLTASITPEELAWKPGPDRWSVAEVVAHLTDTNAALWRRARLIVEEDLPWLDLYGPAAAPHAACTSGWEEIQRFGAARRASVDWLSGLADTAWSRRGRWCGGKVSLSQVLHLWAFHDLGHLCQVAELLRASCHWEAMGRLRRGYAVHP